MFHPLILLILSFNAINCLTDQEVFSKSTNLLEKLEHDMNFKPDGTIIKDPDESEKPTHEKLKNYRLKGIRDIITPELLLHLASAGQSDTFLVAAHNFPVAKMKAKMQSLPLIRLPGHPVSHVVTEMMKLITLDQNSEFPIMMPDVPMGKNSTKAIEIRNIVKEGDGRNYNIAFLAPGKFKEAAENVLAMIQTSDPDEYASVILAKGALSPEDDKYSGWASTNSEDF